MTEAEAKEALYKMGRDHKDKESIDIMLENMWYGLELRININF